MRSKLKVLILSSCLFISVTGFSNNSSFEESQFQIEYQYELHSDGCFYLYRIETIEFQDCTLTYSTPLNQFNYIGTTTICSMSDTIDEFC